MILTVALGNRRLISYIRDNIVSYNIVENVARCTADGDVEKIDIKSLTLTNRTLVKKFDPRHD